MHGCFMYIREMYAMLQDVNQSGSISYCLYCNATKQNGTSIKKKIISNPGGKGSENMFKTCMKAEGENSRGMKKRGKKVSECRLIFHIEALGHLTKQ